VRLIYETHSTSTDNEAGRASGHNDPDLSPLGEQQASELGERRARDRISAVYCSDLLRARRTAEIAFGGTEVPIIQDPRLRECDYGQMNGAPADEVHSVRGDHVTEPFPAGESCADVVTRVASFLDDLRRDHPKDTVLIIAHRAPHHALEHLLNGHDLTALATGAWSWQPGWEYDLL
jgi:broad specificity phosphatase PhoE